MMWSATVCALAPVRSLKDADQVERRIVAGYSRLDKHWAELIADCSCYTRLPSPLCTIPEIVDGRVQSSRSGCGHESQLTRCQRFVHRAIPPSCGSPRTTSSPPPPASGLRRSAPRRPPWKPSTPTSPRLPPASSESMQCDCLPQDSVDSSKLVGSCCGACRGACMHQQLRKIWQLFACRRICCLLMYWYRSASTCSSETSASTQIRGDIRLQASLQRPVHHALGLGSRASAGGHQAEGSPSGGS